MTTELASRFAAVEHRIAEACAAAGRPRGAVRLLAASKTRTPEAIAALHALGQPLFGENRAQEIRDKVDPVHDLARGRGAAAPGGTSSATSRRTRSSTWWGAPAWCTPWTRSGWPRPCPPGWCEAGTGPVAGGPAGAHRGQRVRGGQQERHPAGGRPDLVGAAGALERLVVRGLMTMPPMDADPRRRGPTLTPSPSWRRLDGPEGSSSQS